MKTKLALIATLISISTPPTRPMQAPKIKSITISGCFDSRKSEREKELINDLMKAFADNKKFVKSSHRNIAKIIAWDKILKEEAMLK